jgi:hypothetical protein
MVLLVAIAVGAVGPGAGGAVRNPSRTDMLVYSKPRSRVPTWTATTRIVWVANVMKATHGKGRTTGTVTFTVDGVSTEVPIKGLHHANLIFPTGMGSGVHRGFSRYNGDANFAPSVSPTRTVTIP